MLAPKFPDKVFARIHTSVGDDPNLLVQRERLSLVPGLPGRSKQGVPETHGALAPNCASIRPTERQRCGQAFQQFGIDGRAVGIKYSNKTAHAAV